MSATAIILSVAGIFVLMCIGYILERILDTLKSIDAALREVAP